MKHRNHIRADAGVGTELEVPLVEGKLVLRPLEKKYTLESLASRRSYLSN
jgi:hypothetical protein